ncbi:MAG: CHAT domain-containing protein, partial [Cytophagaceae bacterium]
MNTLLFCYANDRDRPLAELGDEDAGIDRLLDPRSSQGQFQKVRDSFATTDSVVSKIQTYQDTLCLFHFSGHAGSTLLQFEDKQARGTGVAQLLGRCPELRLVFLNGCSTLNHIKLLQAQNVKAAVIATTSPINDTVARQFSIAFYQALVNQYSVQEALDKARLSIQVTVDIPIQRISRGGLETISDDSPDKWYFYCPEDETARWELPIGVTAQATAYVPNSILRKELFMALRAYDDTLAQLFKTKQSLPDDGLRDWVHEEVLRRFPFPISESLRKLLCPQISLEGKLIQPTATRERLDNYIALFDSSIDLMMSLLLSQIRDWLQEFEQRTTTAPMLGPVKQVVQEAITNGWDHWGASELVAAIKTVRSFFDEQQLPYFIKEIKPWLDSFGADADLSDTLQFLFTLKARLADPAGVSTIPSLCQLGEKHLSEWLKAGGFWAVYRLESFKNIRAVRFYQQLPAYRHEMVVLRTSQSYRTDETYFQEVQLPDLWDCQSVLLVRIKRLLRDRDPVEELVPGGFLNLAPFVIDRNVFLKSDNAVFDLYSFHSGEPGQLRYKHISRPGDRLLTIGPDDGDLFGKQDFSVLREQVTSLRDLMGLP